MFRLILLGVLFVLWSGCKKQEPVNDTPAPIYTYYINNKTAHELILKVYATEDGYWGIDSGRPPYISVSLQPFQQNLQVQTTFKDTGILYADIYSPGYQFTNWSSRYSFHKRSNGDTITITSADITDMGYMRSVFMDGQNSTKWRTYDAYDYRGNHIWHQLSAANKNLEVDLYKGWYARVNNQILALSPNDIRIKPVTRLSIEGGYYTVLPILDSAQNIPGYDTATLTRDTVFFKIRRIR